MRMVLTLFAVGAAAAGGYLAGDRGGFDATVLMIAVGVVLAVAMAWMVPADNQPRSVSLRPRPAQDGGTARKVLTPGEAARRREEERILTADQVALRLLDSGRNQIAVIKEIRTYLDLGLREAKELSDAAKKGANPTLAEAMEAGRARDFARALERAGGQVEFAEARRDLV